MAYKRSIVESVGSFDERYGYNEDRDLALGILRSSKIEFNPNMIVHVQKETVTPKGSSNIHLSSIAGFIFSKGFRTKDQCRGVLLTRGACQRYSFHVWSQACFSTLLSSRQS
jgi:GT2 family glycosyltransferase